jgi:hypothetical protein
MDPYLEHQAIWPDVHNSPGSGRRIYLKKRRVVLGSRTSLVEVDVVRAGCYRAALARPNAAPRRDRSTTGGRFRQRPPLVR